MKIATIKHLVEHHSDVELQEAESAILNEEKPAIAVEGKDEAEQLTHVLAAMEIKKYMATNNAGLNEGIRYYSNRVRTSIS